MAGVALTMIHAALAAASLSLSSPTERAVYQRNDENMANVPVKGTFTGAVTRIEARAVMGLTTTPWQVIDSEPSGGNFSGTLSVTGGGWYNVQVRAFSGPSEAYADKVNRVGVGEVFVTAGQSNSANFGAPPQNPNDRVSALTSWSNGVWQHAIDPQPIANGSGGSPWPDFGDAMVAKWNVPIGLVSVGIGGTRVDEWLPGGSLYPRLKSSLEFLGPNGTRAVLWHQGESDSIAGTSSATYASRLNAIIAQSRVDAGWDVPWGVAIASYHPDSSSAQEAQVAAGQQSVIADDPLVFKGAETDNFHNLGYLSDSVHFNDAGLQAHGQQWADAIEQTFSLTAVASYPMGDLNLDNVVDELDWQIFIAGNQADLSNLEPKDAYLMGDLNVDGTNDIVDFGLFVSAFDEAHGEGAFAAMVSLVPEPSSWIFLGVGGLALVAQRGVLTLCRIGRYPTFSRQPHALAFLAVMVAAFAVDQLTLEYSTARPVLKRVTSDEARVNLSRPVFPSAMRIETRAIASDRCDEGGFKAHGDQ